MADYESRPSKLINLGVFSLCPYRFSNETAYNDENILFSQHILRRVAEFNYYSVTPLNVFSNYNETKRKGMTLQE